MSSNAASNPHDAAIKINQPLHYFTGKIRAFWKNVVFFSDQRNVAFAEVGDVFVNGKHASYRDLAYLEELVQRSNSFPFQGPELHSYVSDYHGDMHCPWAHELSGKMLWKAKCAWFGFVPPGIKNDVMNNIVYMPVSYYTGKIVEFYDDRLLFGDSRNSVMVSLDKFYGFREGYNNMHRGSSWPLNDTVHAYIISLDVLADKRLIGPAPYVPIWRKEHFSTDMWVAQFAWQGDMPDVVRDQVERYYVIRMNRWTDIHSVPWIVEDYEQNNSDGSNSSQENLSPKDKGNVQEAETGAHKLFLPVEQKPGLMKGSLLLADENEGLMTSYADVIAFNKENFYVNGNKFIQKYDLSYFFLERSASKMVPLTAWVVPLEKPKLMFNIHVVWHAVCIWCGAPPKDLEYIKKKYNCGKVCERSVKTSSSVSYSHFIGKVKSLSFASGVLISRAGLDQQVKISFKRKDVYIHGSKFHASCSLLDKQHLLESNVWSVLACPLWTDEAVGIPHYRALAVWHYDDQHLMNMLFKTVSDFADLVPALQNTKLGEARNYTREKEKQFSGWIAKVTENYGIIQSGSALVDAVYLYFKKDVLYIDGELLPKGVSLQSLKQGRQCNVQAKVMPPKSIDDYVVTMEATLVWIGRKPSVETSGETTPESSSGSPSHVQNTNTADSGKPSIGNTKTETSIRPDKILRAVGGVMVGDILMADEQHGLIICSDIIVGFSSDIFYIMGKKFKDKHTALNEFLSDRKITVRAMIVTLQEPKVLLNCFVMCEAVCVWIGPEPGDLAILEKTYVLEKCNRAVNTSTLSHKPLLYFLGSMTPVSQEVTLLASTTPEGTAKIISLKEHLFLHGVAVQQNSVYEQWRRKPQNWCVLARSMPPRDINGHLVKYAAIAVWDMGQHHKIRTFLLSTAFHDRKFNEILNGHAIACLKNKANGLSDKMAGDITEALLQKLDLGGKKKGNSVQLTMTSQLNDPSVLVLQIAKTSSGMESRSAFKLGDSIAEHEFCGKHLAGYIMKKTERGGIAQWKSLQFKGYVFIEFSKETLYLNTKPIGSKWKVADVQARPCNLYVIPVPHHSVEECVVSLKATCGWIGKKPSHFPSPGTQLLPKIDLSSVHVHDFDHGDEIGGYDDEDDEDDDEEPDDVEIPLEGYQTKTTVNTGVTFGAKECPQVQVQIGTAAKAQGNITKQTQNGQLSKVNGVTHSQPPSSVPKLNSKTESAAENMWEDKNTPKDHHRGTIVEVHSSVGQVKTLDGSQHLFSRDICYLHGVSLRNVELWHVLAQDDPVHYTVTELVPGMVKVNRVWIGYYDYACNEEAAEYINAWCQEKMVPDGAREILVSQLEMQ